MDLLLLGEVLPNILIAFLLLFPQGSSTPSRTGLASSPLLMLAFAVLSPGKGTACTCIPPAPLPPTTTPVPLQPATILAPLPPAQAPLPPITAIVGIP